MMEKRTWMRPFLIIASALVLVLLLVGFAKPPIPLYTKPVPLVFQEKPHRIASFGVGINEIVLGLSNPKRSIAIGTLPLYDNSKASLVAHKIPLSPENILSLHADLVILPGWYSKTITEVIQEFGIPVLVAKTPTDITSIKYNIRLIGKTLGNQKEANALIAGMNRDLLEAKRISEKGIARQGKLKAVYLTDTGAIGGKGATSNSIFEAAGLINGVAEAGIEGIGTLPKSSVVAMNPDVIIISDDYYTTGKHTAHLKGEILNDPAYAHIKAVKNHRIYVVDAHLITSTSQYISKAVLDIAKQVYGQSFLNNEGE